VHDGSAQFMANFSNFPVTNNYLLTPVLIGTPDFSLVLMGTPDNILSLIGTPDIDGTGNSGSSGTCCCDH